MTKNYTHKIYWNNKYTGAKHAFDTTRKSQEIVNTIGEHNITDPEFALTIAEPEIRIATNPYYYEALQTGNPQFLAESNGFEWDYGIYEMALNSTAGVIAATHWAYLHNTVAGSLSSGLHHASHNKGDGFCTINGLAVAANMWEDLHIIILDFDAHCGGGTVNTLRYLGIDNRVEQYDISTNMFDEYRTDPTHNIFIAKNNTDYLQTVDRILDDMKRPELILYNAGTDPHPTISHDTLAERDNTVFQYAKDTGTPIAYVLAGGYTYAQTMEQLVQSHINTLDAAERTQ